jgi:hypothetical protein
MSVFPAARNGRPPAYRPQPLGWGSLSMSLSLSSLLKGARYAPPVRMIKLTEARSITPYKWVHPDEER